MRRSPVVARFIPALLAAMLMVPCHAEEDFIRGGPQALLTITRTLTESEIASRDTHAKYEPPAGCYLGAFIDFDGTLKRPVPGMDHQDPAAFEAIVHRAHAMYFFYLGYGRPLPVGWVRWLAAHGKFVQIALEPNDGLKAVKDNAYLRRLADDMAATHASIFLRFGSEMNGNWTNYHKNPAQFRRAFRLIHDVMKRRAPNVAMVWCPYMTPIDNIDRYYPGDDATDWVGVNLYNVTYHNNHLREPAENEHPCDLLTYVYRRYSARKPVMICEYAATHNSAVEHTPRPAFAFRKIVTLYQSLPRLFPRVKCINYFDSNNLEFVSDAAFNDYSVTDDPTVEAAYRYCVASPYFLDAPLPANAARLPPVPVPLRAGEELRGDVRLSCFARAPSDIVTVRYLVDGHPIYRASRPDLWECIWNAGSVRPGRHKLTLEVRGARGRLAASQSLSVVAAQQSDAPAPAAREKARQPESHAKQP